MHSRAITGAAVGLALLAGCGQPQDAGGRLSSEVQGRLALIGILPEDSASGVLVIDLATGDRVRVGDQQEARSAAWAGSDRIAVVRGGAYAQDVPGELVLAAADGSDDGTPIAAALDVLEVTASADGAHLAWLGRTEHSAGACLEPPPAATGLYVAAGDGSGARRVLDVPAASSSPVLSPDGGTVALLDHGNDTAISPGRDWCDPGEVRLVLVDTTTGAYRVVTGIPEIAEAPRWSPDGATLVLGGGDFATSPARDLVFVDVASATARRVVTPDVSESMPVFSPDGQQLAALSGAGHLDPGNASILVGDPDGTGLRTITATGTDDVDLVWTPDASHLVVAGAVVELDCEGCDTATSTPSVRIVDARGGDLVEVFDTYSGFDPGLAFAP